MKSKFLVVSSITYALRGRAALQDASIQSFVEKYDALSDQNGCGYGIRVDAKDYQPAIRVLKNAGVHVISAKNMDR